MSDVNRIAADNERIKLICCKHLAMQRARVEKKQKTEAKQKEDLIKLERRMKSMEI